MIFKKVTETSRRASAMPLKEAINELLQVYNLKQKFDEKQVISFWGKVMGPPIASRTSSLYVKDKKLFVKLTSAPLKNELNMSKGKVLQLLEKEFGPGVIEDVVFM
jgi:predicted nucleic acid-binding Zn ribbon protein